MRLAFLDLCTWDYDVDTPHERSLGGSQSALAYLTVELARRGHGVDLYTRTSRPGLRRGVRCVGFEGTLVPRGLGDEPYDAAVVLNGPAEAGPELRAALVDGAPLWMWTQHADDQPAMAAMTESAVRDSWDRIACVSAWQRGTMLERFGLDAGRVHVRRNGIGPRFEGLFEGPEDLLAAKSGPATITYTSTPFRGLEILLHAFDSIRAALPEARLEVFSSLEVYQVRLEEDPCAALYEECRNTPGVRYRGSRPQPELAASLRPMSALAYPNTFPETSCISVLEALAAGMLVVTSRLGALPETTLGFGELVNPMAASGKPSGGGDDERIRAALAFSDAFATALLAQLERRARDPEAFARERWLQVEEVGRTCTWARRAEEWEAMLAERAD